MKSTSTFFWLLAIGLVLSSATQAQITVTSTADSGPGSLRQAIVNASSGNTINITVTGTIVLTTGQLIIDKDLTITGPGASQLTISGNNVTRVFFINPGAAGATTGPPSGNLVVTIKELTIANGRASGGDGGNGGGAGGGAAGMGGGLFINRGTVAVDHVSFTGNQAVGGTGGRGGYGTSGSGGGGGGFGGNGNRTEIGGEGGALGGSGGTYVFGANGGSGGDGAGGGGGGCCSGELGGSGGFGGGGGGGASFGTSTGGSGGFGGGGGGGGGTNSGGGIGAAGGTFGGTGGSQVGTYNDGGGGGGGGLGGAIFIRAGSITVTQSSFTGNQATPGVGGLAKNGTASGTAGQGKGGAIFILDAGATASISANTTYSNNTATDAGSVTTDNANTYGTFSTCAAFTATLTPSGQLTCANSTVTLTAGGGLAGATYQYSLGATNNGSTATVIADGPYSVTVTNPGGCSSTATTTVTSNTAVPTVSITPSTTAICAGQTATFTASGSPASYSWSSGQTTANISATAQGPYSVTATNTDNGCQTSATANLTVNPLPTPAITNLNEVYCKDATPVTLIGSPTGGAFTIDGTTATTFNPASLSVGQHTVVYSYTNATGCSAATSRSITVNSIPSPTLVASGGLTCSQTSVTLTTSGGTSYTFTSPGGTVLAGSGNTRTVSSPGTYSVTAANASGCVSSTSTSVLSNTAVITVSNPTTSTATLNTPFSQSFTASGGASPYSYSLTSGSLPAGLSLSTTGVLSGTPSQGGSFTLVVRGQDANGCFDLGPTYILQVNATPTITGFGAVDNTVCVGSPISFTATVGNVTGAYAFTLSIGTNSLSGTATGAAFSRSLTASGSGTQSFTLTVGDNGFQATAQTTVTVNALPPATLVGSGTLTCGNTSVTLTASPAGQSSYAFSAGATQISTSNQATVSQAGTYSVTVTNAGGCSAVAQVTVTGSTTAPSVAVNRPTNPSSCSGSNGSISFTTNLADGPYSLTYTGSGSPGTVTVSSGAFSLTGLSAGSYSNFSISNNGCVGTAAGPVSLTAPTAPTATLDNNGPLTCATTSVTLTASLGGAGYMFSPNANQIGGSPGNTATVDRPGMYTVVVTSANGCSASATTTVMSNTTAPDAPLIATQSGHSYPGGVSTLTVAQNTGAVVLMVSGCSGGTITWSGGTSSTLSVATQTTGTQTFTATCTSNGCPSQLATATITVIAPTLTVLSRDPDNGQLNTNTLKPYLQLNNQSTTPIAYSEITIRYWLTVENPAPLIYQINYAQMGNDKVHLTYVPISPLRQGATGYIEFSFDASAGSLAGNTSAVIQDLINKQDYSMFFQGDDYSYVNNPNFAPNPHITAYQNGVLIYGTEPGQAGPPPVLMLTASANPATILTTGSTQLQANVSGGTPGYTYSFSGPGTIAPSGNTASVSGLMAGVQTFTVTVTDVTTPVNQTIATTVSVTVTAPPANTPPMPTANPNQTATVGVLFSYAVNAFGDNETPNSLTYTASINPANGFTFNPATRVVQGSPQNTGVSSVTITATDPGGLSASTIFTITVSPAPVAPTALSLSLSASPTTILTTGTTTLSATVSGGTLPYGYAFAGPGTITPSGNTATVSNLPAGVQTFTVVVRDASSPSSQSISTTVSVTVNAPSPSATQLTVLSRDPENGNLNTNTIRPYLLLQNDGSTPIPYGELTVRYYLTLENPAPLHYDVNYAQMGNDKVYFNYVPLSPARQGATGYIEFSFDASAGSLGAGSNAVIQDLINKQDYSYFNQGDDYSYRNTGNFTANAHITAYRNGVLIYGTEPPTGARLSAENADAPLMVRVLGNPLSGGEMTVDIQGAAGQSLRLRVTDLAGHLVSEQAVERAGAQERQRLGVGRASAGLLFLQVSTPTQSQTVKVLKVD